MPFDFLRRRPTQILTVALLAHAALIYGLSHGESVPITRPLEAFPTQLGKWTMLENGVMEQEVKDVLRADDYLTRFYGEPDTKAVANLYVAFFKSQRTGQTPHSPKNCLPGSGWVPSSAGMIDVNVPGEAEPIRINRYVVAKGDSKSLVLYWYQSRGRVVASEYKAKVLVVADALRYNRTDTALVRVVVPISGDEEPANGAAVRFIQAFFESLRGFLPA